MKYWDITENPTGEVYRELIKVLCDYSDQFYFVTRKELTYDQEAIAAFKPFFIKRYQAKEWANTMTKGPPVTVYVIEINDQTRKLLQGMANTLYDWVAPNLPEDLTFLKNDFAWFTSTAHEEFSGFSIRSDYYRELIEKVSGLEVEKVE